MEDSKFKKWLKDNRYSLSRFAVQLGMCRSHVQMIASGYSLPSFKLAARIEHFTGGAVTYKDFVDYQEEKRLFEEKKGEPIE